MALQARFLMLHNYHPPVAYPPAVVKAVEEDTRYRAALVNADAFLRTRDEIRALPEKEEA